MNKIDELLPGGVLTSRLFAKLVQRDRSRDESLPPGATIGPYRIDALLGAGGCSEVYRATRSDGLFAQHVALKRLRSGDSRHQRAFRRERDILAKLDHPGIARLFESGTLDDGSGWMAMTLVDGRRIDEFVRAEAPAWLARVDLIEQVAAALQHAHLHGLIHRDVKPSNVLVDENGRATLIDFGIALAPKPGGLTGEPGALTPEYASPEQLQGMPVTLASDIYQLGRLLAIVLRGERDPCERTRPPRKVRAQLRAIVACACADVPAARYPSVNAFRSALRAVSQRSSPWWCWW